MEHKRVKLASGAFMQWVDTQACVVMDRVTGQLERINPTGYVVTLEQALEWVGASPRSVIIKLETVQSFETQKP